MATEWVKVRHGDEDIYLARAHITAVKVYAPGCNIAAVIYCNDRSVQDVWVEPAEWLAVSEQLGITPTAVTTVLPPTDADALAGRCGSGSYAERVALPTRNGLLPADNGLLSPPGPKFREFI